MQICRKFGAAALLAGLIASGMMAGTARVEAKGKGGGGGGGDSTAAICAYLASILNYPYVSPYIAQYNLALFQAYGCDPALLN